MKRKILHLILSGLVAFGLWLYVITTVNPGYETTFYNIPVILTNEPALADSGLMLDMKSTPTVTLKLSGNRSDLIRLDNSNIMITLDLSRIHEAGEQSLSYTITFPGDVAEGSIDVLSKLPGTITVTTVATATKTIPIVPEISGSVPEGYLHDPEDAVLSAETVKIHGPASVIEKITQAKFYVDMNGRTQSVFESFALTLCDANGDPVEADRVTSDITEVNMSLRVQRYKEVSLVLNVTYGGGSTAQNTLISIDPSVIAVSGSDQLLDSMGDTLVLGELDMKEILQELLGNNTEKALDEPWTKTFDIILPDGTENVTNVTEATVSVTFQDLVIKKLTVSNFEIKNLLPGYVADVVTRNLNVIVCGPKSQVSALKSSDLVAEVDLSFVTGVMDNKVSVVIRMDEDRFSGVGILEAGKPLIKVTERLIPDPTDGTIQG